MRRREGRRVVLGVSELSIVYSSHHDDPSGAPEPQDATVEAANPDHQRQDSSEGMPSPPGQALGRPMARERETRANCVEPFAATRDRSQQGDPTATDDREDA